MKNSRRKFIKETGIAVMGGLAIPYLGQGNSHIIGKMVQLVTLRFCCDKTTEQGADEVIIYVIATCAQKNKILSYRFPNDSIYPVHNKDHIDMNDGGQPTNNRSGDSHCITDEYFGKNIFKQTVDPGDHWEIAVFIIEEDGGDTASAQQMAQEILQNVPNPYAQAGSYLLNIMNKFKLKFYDSNDYIGSFAVTVRAETDGTIASGFTPGDRVNFEISQAKHMQCRFNGDGTNYLGEFKLLFDGEPLK